MSSGGYEVKIVSGGLQSKNFLLVPQTLEWNVQSECEAVQTQLCLVSVASDGGWLSATTCCKICKTNEC